MSADDVGVGRSTAEKDAGRCARDRCVGRPRGNTASRTKAKKTRQEYENKRREEKNRKNMSDTGTTAQASFGIEPPERPGNQPKCLFCGLSGIVVPQFPRRAYGGRVFSEEIDPKREGYFFKGAER